MKNVKMKLVISLTAVLMAILLLGGASLAWMTISTNPEVSGMSVTMFTSQTLLLSTDNEDYQRYIDVSSAFDGLAPLHPISTIDGIHWYLPIYDDSEIKTGNVTGFELDVNYEHANVKMYTGDKDNTKETTVPIPYNTEKYLEAEAKGYYVFTDFWVKSELDDGCKVRISVPHLSDATDTTSYALMKEDIDYKKYGTYVMSMYQTEKNNQISRISNLCETAMRVGFLIYDCNADGTPKTSDGKEVVKNFVIFEPNAEKRSRYNRTGKEEDAGENIKANAGNYVWGYTYNPSTYVDGNYFETKPIVAQTDEEGNVTYVPTRINGYGNTKLIIQKSSQWNEEKLAEYLAANEKPLSDSIQYFGLFCDTTSMYTALGDKGYVSKTDLAKVTQSNSSDKTLVLNLPNSNPVKIRMFVWIEGQDVDCWNDIACGSFLMNIELAGEDN